MIFLFTWFLGILVGIITTLANPAMRSLGEISRNLLFYQMTVSLFLSGLISFVGHVFRSDAVAVKIGWETGSPFQKELGFAELGYAFAGILCIWFQKDFWLAAIVIASPLYVLAGINHVWEMVVKKNYASHNTWTILPDFLLPLTWVVLFCLAK